jgi:BolA protein
LSLQHSITEKLSKFAPVFLTVENESHLHSGPANRETHFRIVMVSDLFEGLSRVKRHQNIYALFEQELSEGLHALSLHLYAPDEWQGEAPESPKCAGKH